MDKEQLTESIAGWLKKFLEQKFGSEYDNIEIIKPTRNLNLLSDSAIRDITGSNAWEFKPDIIAALTKSDGPNRIVLVNRSTSSISLKEIGEMNCYAQLSVPMLAMVVSPKAASSEVNGILLDNHMRERILDFGGDYPLSVVGWDEENNMPSGDSISPIDMESFFLS